ncbi:hypothetical protein L7F22_021213 [Adiantum nelumboides]|nr:hypothetical protein [Adiantum nelumboides]
MKKQNDRPDPLEDAVQKCKEKMIEIINKINRNLLGTIKMLEDRVLGDCMTAQGEEIASLKKELVEARSRNTFEEEELQPSAIEELNTLKERLRAIKEGKEQHKEMTTSWVDVITKTQQKADEVEKWIEVAKKGKSKEITSTSTIINVTLEEEQRRCVRSLHVKICGLKHRNNVDEEKQLKPIKLKGIKPEDMDKDKWNKMDELTLSTIMLTLVESVYFNVADEISAYDAWTKLSGLCEKQSAASQVYCKKLVDLKMKEGTPMSNHLNEFNAIYNQLSAQGY